jgi:hypothetical protein
VPQPIKIHIEQQHIHPLFSKKTKLPSLHMTLNQLLDSCHRQVSSLCHPIYLEQRRGR